MLLSNMGRLHPSLDPSSPNGKWQEFSGDYFCGLNLAIFSFNHRILTYIYPWMSIQVTCASGLSLSLMKCGIISCLYYPQCLVLTNCPQALWAESLALTPANSYHQEKRQVHMGHR